MAGATTELVFVLHDRVGDSPLTLKNCDITTLREFIQDVETLINGDSRTANLAESRITLESGSIKIKTMLLAVAAFGLEKDIAKLESSRDLDTVPLSRAKVIARWQGKARESETRSYSVELSTVAAEFRVNAITQYEHRSENFWIGTRKYLTGEIFDVGGKLSPNVHMVLPNGTTVKISVSREQVLDDEANPVFRNRTAYVQAEQHTRTKDLRNAKLIEFVRTPDPRQDSSASLEALWKAGSEAWADVASPEDWVEEMRGNK